MRHKHCDNPTINMVNYLANSVGSMCAFYSFVEVTGSMTFWAWMLDGKYYCALNLSNRSIDKCVSDHDELEAKQIEQGLLYPAYLKGSDNTSYIKRFRTMKEMTDWALEVKEIDVDKDPTLLYYNS